jgi:hypothetical protein
LGTRRSPLPNICTDLAALARLKDVIKPESDASKNLMVFSNKAKNWQIKQKIITPITAATTIILIILIVIIQFYNKKGPHI